MAHGLHLQVPGDIAVCGFDDTPVATTVWPELTTIHQPITPYTLVTRESTSGQE